jgi:predicted ester cyclase
MHADIEDELCEGDKVVARVTMHGRHVGEFLGKPPTGKKFAAEQIHIWRVMDGKVIEHWSVRDDLGQALQLGLIGG